MKMLLITIIAVCCVGYTMGYPEGAPTESCETMRPIHNGAEPQDTPSPYIVSASPNKIGPNSVVNIRISTNYADDYYEGYFVQVRDASNTPVGKFEASDIYKVIDCPEEEIGLQNAATHNEHAHFTTTDLYWIAPDTPINVNLTFTIVRSFSTFWADIKIPLTVDEA